MGPLVSVAMRLATGVRELDEALMRRYLWDRRLTEDGCSWLNAQARRAGSQFVILRDDARNRRLLTACAWHLTAGGREGALVRRERTNGDVLLYQGAYGAERKVRCEKSDGVVVELYAGVKGA